MDDVNSKNGYTNLLNIISDYKTTDEERESQFEEFIKNNTGLNFEIEDNENRTPLMWALNLELTNIAIKLIKAGAILKSESLNDVFNLDSDEIFNLLFEKGVDFLYDDVTLLMLAAAHGNERILERLIQQNASVDIQDDDGLTALMASSLNPEEYDYVNIAQKLIEAGANMNIRNKIGNTALMVAISHGKIGISKVLIEKGADLNIRNNEDQTALMLAHRQNNFDIISLLEKSIITADLLKDEDDQLRKTIIDIIRKNPFSSKWKSDDDYISDLLKKNNIFNKNPKSIVIVIELLKKQKEKQLKAETKKKNKAAAAAVLVNVADERVTTADEMVTNVYEVGEEVVVKKDKTLLSINEEIVSNLQTHLEKFMISVAEPNTRPDYRNGILSITCFTKKDKTRPNDYVLDIGLHGLWPWPIMPTGDNVIDINFEHEFIKNQYKLKNPYILPKKTNQSQDNQKNFLSMISRGELTA